MKAERLNEHIRFFNAQHQGDRATENDVASRMGDWDDEDYDVYNKIRNGGEVVLDETGLRFLF